MINSCSFGRIVIEGTTYTKDVVIYPDGHVQSSWRRKKGHSLCFDDIRELIEAKPDIVVAGTGAYGIMKPEAGLAMLLSEKGIEFMARASGKAAQEYNRIFGTRAVGACFHLTC